MYPEKFTETRNKELDTKAKAPLHPVPTESLEGYKYVQSFTDNYSCSLFGYFLRKKSDTVLATEKFLADICPYGTVT